MAEAGLNKSTVACDRRASDGGESNRDGTKNNSQPQAVAAPAAEAPEESKYGGHDNDNDLFVAGGRQEWQVILALFSSNLSFATEGPGRNNDHYDPADDDKEKGEEGESTKEEANGSPDQPETKRAKIRDRKEGDEGEAEDKTSERSATTIMTEKKGLLDHYHIGGYDQWEVSVG